MDVSLDRGEDDLALCLPRCSAHGILDDGKTRLCRLGRHQKLGEKERPLLEALPDEVERRNEVMIDEVHGIHARRDRIPCLLRRPARDAVPDRLRESGGRAVLMGHAVRHLLPRSVSSRCSRAALSSACFHALSAS